MKDYTDLLKLHTRSTAQQKAVRRETFSPAETKKLRRFSTWEVSEFILNMKPNTLRKKLAADPGLPQGETEGEGGQRWFSLEEINGLRRRIRYHGGRRLPKRPPGRALRVGVSNFKGGVGKTVVAHHFAHAAALDGYRVLVVDFDPQATLTHSMGLVEVNEENTVWGILGRDLYRESERVLALYETPEECPYPAPEELPHEVQECGVMRVQDFIEKTCWPTIDIIPSCANAAFVEFATAQYRALHGAWTFFGCVARYLDELPDDQYDFVIFDCPPAIGYQSLNAVYAADILYIPSGPGWWEYDSTTSYLGQLGDALGSLKEGFSGLDRLVEFPVHKHFLDIRLLMTRYDSNNVLHRTMRAAFKDIFGEGIVCRNVIEQTRAVEQSGRFHNSVYEQDYRQLTRETWRRARQSFDAAYQEFLETSLGVWERRESGGGEQTADAAVPEGKPRLTGEAGKESR